MPLTGSRKPAIRLSTVVLPQPLGPSRQKNSPSVRLTEKRCNTDTASTPRRPASRQLTSPATRNPSATDRRAPLPPGSPPAAKDLPTDGSIRRNLLHDLWTHEVVPVRHLLDDAFAERDLGSATEIAQHHVLGH